VTCHDNPLSELLDELKCAASAIGFSSMAAKAEACSNKYLVRDETCEYISPKELGLTVAEYIDIIELCMPLNKCRLRCGGVVSLPYKSGCQRVRAVECERRVKYHDVASGNTTSTYTHVDGSVHDLDEYTKRFTLFESFADAVNVPPPTVSAFPAAPSIVLSSEDDDNVIVSAAILAFAFREVDKDVHLVVEYPRPPQPEPEDCPATVRGD